MRDATSVVTETLGELGDGALAQGDEDLAERVAIAVRRHVFRVEGGGITSPCDFPPMTETEGPRVALPC